MLRMVTPPEITIELLCYGTLTKLRGACTQNQRYNTRRHKLTPVKLRMKAY